MKQSERAISLSLFLLLTMLAVFVVVARAAEIPAGEGALNPAGRVFEVNPDQQGYLWLADLDAGEIWQVEQASGDYTVYRGIPSPSDARRAPDGSVWWGDLEQGRVGRLDPWTGALTWWQTSASMGIFGVHFDASGRVWATAEEEPHLYRFNPVTEELCTYTLPDDGNSYYLVGADDAVWLGDHANGRLYRLTPSANQFTYWELPTDSTPYGLTLTSAGDLWYADPNLGFLGRLRPAQDELTLFNPPRGFLVQMLAVAGNRIWYTDRLDGALGNLDPEVASATTSTATRATAPATPSCATQTPAATGTATTVTGTFVWSQAAYPSLADADGWQLYELPSQSLPDGVASGGSYVWYVDPGRKVLGRIDYAATVTVCLLADEDGSGSTTSDRNPLPGWTVYLTIDGVRQEPGSTTDNAGCARWEGLPPGQTYGVEQVVPEEWVPMNGTNHTFGIASAGSSYTRTFLNAPAETGAFVYLPMTRRAALPEP